MTDGTAATGGRSIEWWYAAHFAYGALHMGFIPILVPTYVVARGGSPSEVGLLVTVYGMAAFLIPFIGRWADRARAYRAVQLGGLAAYALGALPFIVSGPAWALALGTVCLGVGTTAMLSINPAFIVGARLPRAVQARAMMRLNQAGMVGTILGALAVAALTQAALPFAWRFAAMAVLALVCLLLTAATNGPAAARLARAERRPAEASDAAARPGRVSLRFGNFLLALVVGNVGLDLFYGQYPGYMQRIFGVGSALSATALSVGPFLTLALLEAGGRWMGRDGARSVWAAALWLRIAACLALIGLALAAPVWAALPLGFYALVRLSNTWAGLSQPILASELSAGRVGSTQGLVVGALAAGFMLGNLFGGWLADGAGFASLPVAAALVTAAGLLLGLAATAPAPAPAVAPAAPCAAPACPE